MIAPPFTGFSVEGGTLEEIHENNNNNNNNNDDTDEKGKKKIALNIIDSPLAEDVLEEVFDVSGKDNDFIFYRDQIMNRGEHMNFLCVDSPQGPIAISVYQENMSKLYVALIRRVEGNKRATVPFSWVPLSWWRRLFHFPPSTYDILTSLDSNLPVSRLKRVYDPRLPQALLNIEEQQQIKGFKFGVLYAKEGQTKEDEMFSNVETSPAFDEFLNFLGDRLNLNNWKGFRGGLDVRSGTTGHQTIYKRFNNNEIIFHVSTMLPFNPKDKQQLERKRHIGNDIVVILFQDGNTPYKPSTISSRQVHVVFVVKKVTVPEDPETTYYRLAIVSREGVPAFGPSIPNNSLHRKGENFFQLLYAKLLNAEKACYHAPILSNKLNRTRTSLLRDIAQNFTA